MPHRKAPATQAQDDENSEENFEEVDDLDEGDGGRRRKGGASRRSGAGSASIGLEDIEKKANDLCRLALFTEYRRLILKREEINKKVMGGNSKVFPLVLERANKRLKNAFGYEIVEIMSRAERERLQTGQTEADDEPKKKGVSSKQYIVRNILDPELIQLACAPDADIRQQEEEDALDEDEHFTGSIIAWQTADQIPAYGILYVILSLILVNGKALADATLRSHMKKLRLISTSTVEVGTSNSPKRIQFEQYLNLLIKQGYLDRIVVGTKGGVKGGKRPRGVRQDGEEGTVDVEWKWGERAQAEISEQGVSSFVVNFMTERSILERDQPENERERATRLEKLKKRLTKDVKKAAQSPLTIIENAAHDGEHAVHG